MLTDLTTKVFLTRHKFMLLPSRWFGILLYEQNMLAWDKLIEGELGRFTGFLHGISTMCVNWKTNADTGNKAIEEEATNCADLWLLFVAGDFVRVYTSFSVKETTGGGVCNSIVRKELVMPISRSCLKWNRKTTKVRKEHIWKAKERKAQIRKEKGY